LLPTYGKPDDGPRSDDPPGGSSTGSPPAGEKAPGLEPTRNSDPRPIERPAPPLGMSSREIEDLRDLVELLQIQLEAKRAEYQEAEVTLKQAAQSRSRIAGLNKAAAVSAEEVQNAENQVQIQEARLVVKRATVREAEVRLAQARRRLERVAPPDSRSPGQRPQPTAKGRGPDPRAGSEKPAVASPDANAAYEKRLADLDAKIQALLEETRALRGHKPAAPPTKDPGLEEVRAYQFGVGEGPLAFLPDGKSFLRGMRGGLLQWDVATGRILRGLDAPLGAKGDVTAVAVSPDGKVFVSAKRASDGDGSSVTLWDAATGKVLARYFRAGADFPCLAVSPDGKLLALGDSELGALRLLDIPTGKVKQDRDVGNGIRAVAFSPDGRRVACGGVEGRIYIGDVQTGARVLNIATASHLTSLAYSPDGKLILTGDDQGALLLWDADSGNPVRQIKGPVAAVVQARFLPDGRTIFSAAGDRLSLWDAATGQELVQSRKARDGGSDAGRFQAIALSPDGRQALTNENGTLRLWEVRSGRFDRRAEGH
jgi:NACalpha-BTF3-like transcription factor